MTTDLTKLENLSWVDFKTYLDNELVHKCTKFQLIDLLRESQSIESPLSMKYEYIYNKLIVYDENVELLTQNVSKRTWKALLKRRGYDFVTHNLSNKAARIPLYVLNDYIKSTKQIHLLHPSNHHLAVNGTDYNHYASLASTAVRSTGDINMALKCFEVLDNHRKDIYQGKFMRHDKGLLSFFVTISKLWNKNQDNEDITQLLRQLAKQADINILSTTDVILHAVIKLLKSFPIQSRFKYLYTIEKRLSLTMTIKGELLPGVAYSDAPRFEGISVSILYLLPSSISLPLLENLKHGRIHLDYTNGLPLSLNRKLSPLLAIDKESFINGYRIAILARNKNRARLFYGKDSESDDFTSDIIANVKDRCKTTSDRDVRRSLVSQLLLYSAISNTELYSSLNWALGRFVNDDLTRSEMLAGYDSYEYVLVDHYLYFFDELSGLALLQGLGQDALVDRQHMCKCVVQAANTGNKLLKKYIEVALHSSENVADFTVNEYDNLSKLLLEVLNRRLALIEKLGKLRCCMNNDTYFVNELLEPIKTLFGEWISNKLSAKKGSAIYQSVNPPTMLVQPHGVLLPEESPTDVGQTLRLPLSMHGARIACEFTETLAEYVQEIRDEHPSKSSKPENGTYHSKIPFIISIPDTVTRKPFGKRLRRLLGECTPYLSTAVQKDVKDVNEHQLQTEWARGAFGISIWYKMLQTIGKDERTTVLTDAIKSLAEKMSSTTANPLDYLYAVVALAPPDRCYDMAEFLFYLHSCDTKFFLEQLNIDSIVNDSRNFIKRTIKEEYITIYEDKQWPTTPYQVVSKVFLLLNYHPYNVERLRCNRISEFLSTSFQQKLAGLSMHVLTSAVDLENENDRIVVKDTYPDNRWLIGINLLAASRNGANHSHVEEILSRMKDHEAKYTKQRWISMIKDLITVITPVGLQAHDTIIDTLVAVTKDPDQIQSQLKLFNGGYLSTIPISEARCLVLSLVDLITKQEIHKLTTIKIIISGMMVNAQSGMSVKGVCDQLTSIAIQVDHPSIQGFIVNQLLKMVNNNLPFAVIENILSSNFSKIISRMELSTEAISLISDSSVELPVKHVKSIVEYLDLDTGDKPFVEAVFMKKPYDIPVAFHFKWVQSLEGFANRYMEQLGILAMAVGDRMKLSHAVKYRNVPKLFTNFVIRWENILDKDSTLMKLILQNSMRLVYALDEDSLLSSTQNGAFINSLFKYSLDFDQEAFNSFICLHNVDKKSNKSLNPFTWHILNALSAHIVKLETSRESIKALKLASFVHKCLDLIAVAFIGSVEDMNVVIDTLTQIDVGVFSQRLRLHLFAYKSVLFDEYLDGGLSEVPDQFKDEYSDIVADIFASIYDDLTVIEVTKQAVDAGVSDRCVYAYLKSYTSSAAVQIYARKLLSNDKYEYVASRIFLHTV